METLKKINLHTQAALALVCAIAYFYAFKLNLYWFDLFEFSTGVNWVFIPSGLRLLFVLILLETGALGIAAASLLINYTSGSVDAHVFNLVTALISGGAPYLARHIAVNFLKLSPQLSGLTAAGFFKISVLFAIVSAALHQIWFYGNGRSDNWLNGTFVMGIGDWFGTVLVLAFASLMIKGYQFMSDRVIRH